MCYDRNVTADKLTVVIERETELIAAFEEMLVQFYKEQQTQFYTQPKITEQSSQFLTQPKIELVQFFKEQQTPFNIQPKQGFVSAAVCKSQPESSQTAIKISEIPHVQKKLIPQTYLDRIFKHQTKPMTYQHRPEYRPLQKHTCKMTNNYTLETPLTITPAKFLEMSVIGQFNLGFIICLIGSSIFIVDQHAADEKYKYEYYHRMKTIRTQLCAFPVPLTLTSVEQECVEILHTQLHAAGFVLNKSKDNDCVYMLTGVSDISGIILTVNDLRQILEVYMQSGRVKECARVNSIFASRACRSAVMIGDSLGKKEMRNIVDRLSGLCHPFNCPHGRPTVRLLAGFEVSEPQA